MAGNSVATCRDAIPVLKRFSGGGTVIVDKNTVFTTFICNVVRLDHYAIAALQCVVFTRLSLSITI